jgi:hypothetical protein
VTSVVGLILWILGYLIDFNSPASLEEDQQSPATGNPELFSLNKIMFRNWGGCYDPNFMRFFAIFFAKNSKTNVLIKFLHTLALF